MRCCARCPAQPEPRQTECCAAARAGVVCGQTGSALGVFALDLQMRARRVSRCSDVTHRVTHHLTHCVTHHVLSARKQEGLCVSATLRDTHSRPRVNSGEHALSFGLKHVCWVRFLSAGRVVTDETARPASYS
eukprot:7375948-Prymnesium_polylepis.1